MKILYIKDFFLMYKFTTLSSRFHRMDYIYYNIYSIHVRNSFVLVTDERKISLNNECKYICIAIITNISTFVSKSFKKKDYCEADSFILEI